MSRPVAAKRAGIEEITAILVSWRDADDLEGSVESLAAARSLAGARIRVSLVVVANGAGSVRPDRIRAIWPDAVIITNPENVGFGPAANQGAAAAPGDVLLFLNPDTRAEKDPFTPLAAGFDERHDAVALAPRLDDASDVSGVCVWTPSVDGSSKSA